MIAYIIIGLLWSLYWESKPNIELNNFSRLRLIFCWPIYVTAWIVGFVLAWIRDN